MCLALPPPHPFLRRISSSLDTLLPTTTPDADNGPDQTQLLLSPLRYIGGDGVRLSKPSSPWVLFGLA